MERVWYRHDQETVVEALRRGERPDMATTMASGPLDELVGLHETLGIFEVLDALPTDRQRQGIEDRLLFRTLAALPFVEQGSFTGAVGQLFGEPAVLLHLGWSPLQIEIGDNERHRHPQGRNPKARWRRVPQSRREHGGESRFDCSKAAEVGGDRVHESLLACARRPM
jgi:hypothetical protein